MGLKNWQGQGPNWVAAYQTSGTPYVTSSGDMDVSTSVEVVRFPYVTRWIQITNTSENGDLRIGFSENGVNGLGQSVSGSAFETTRHSNNYFILSGSRSGAQSTTRLELRCKEIYFRRNGSVNAGFSLIAGLTGISHNQFPVLTGSGGFRGIG